jgi:hypothetical protein
VLWASATPLIDITTPDTAPIIRADRIFMVYSSNNLLTAYPSQGPVIGDPLVLCSGLISILRKWGNGESVRASRFGRPTLIRLQHVAQRTHRLESYLQVINVLITKCNTAKLYWVGVMTSGCLKRADTFFSAFSAVCLVAALKWWIN